MNDPLPAFRYHPDPVGTGAVVVRPVHCIVCGRVRSHTYVGPIYCVRSDVGEKVCPWCIASGAAAEALQAMFIDARVLQNQGIPEPVISEVSLRTPGFHSWQGQTWLAHCGNAAAFCGDATKSDVVNMSSEQLAPLLQACRLDMDEWMDISAEYTPSGDPSIYRFQCVHCTVRLFALDCG
jgi:uncharacterized protein